MIARASALPPERSARASIATRPPHSRSGQALAALTLQRAAGNRAAGRVLARWIKHPDADKKGVMVPDVVAQELVRFNPPSNA